MAIKFFMLQSHYSSTNDLTDGGLLAAEKGFKRLMEAEKTLEGLSGGIEGAGTADASITEPLDKFLDEMCDDFNTPRAIAQLFELVTKINSIKEGHINMNDISYAALAKLKETFPILISDVLGLESEQGSGGGNGALDSVMNLVLELRQDARTNKNWATSDKIRDALAEASITVKDGKEGSSWTMN